MILKIVVYLAVCFLVALVGMNRKYGFWGNFFVSLFLTPLVGVIVLLASDRRRGECPRCSYDFEGGQVVECPKCTTRIAIDRFK